MQLFSSILSNSDLSSSEINRYCVKFYITYAKIMTCFLHFSPLPPVCLLVCTHLKKKVQQKLFLSTSGRRIGGVKEQLYSFLKSALDERECSTSLSLPFAPIKVTRQPPSRRLGGPTDGVKCGEDKISCPFRIRTPECTIRSLVATPKTTFTTLYQKVYRKTRIFEAESPLHTANTPYCVHSFRLM